MKLKLFKKYFLTTALIILISLTAMMMILVLVFNNYLASSKYKTLRECVTSVIDIVSDSYFYTDDNDALFHIMNTISKVSEVDVFIADKNGEVVICSCEEWLESGGCEHSGRLVSQDTLERAEKGDIIELSTLDIYENPHYVSASPISSGNGGFSGAVFATAPMSAIKLLLRTISKLYLLSAAIPLIIMFFAI